MWSPTKLNFLFYDFCDLLWFLKDATKIDVKEKDKKSKTAREVMCLVLRDEGETMSDFIVEWEKTDFFEWLGGGEEDIFL